MKLISADEARLYAEDNIRKIQEKEMQCVMDEVRKSIDMGLFHFSYDGSLNNATIKAIKELGYRVECPQRENGYTISWGGSN